MTISFKINGRELARREKQNGTGTWVVRLFPADLSPAESRRLARWLIEAAEQVVSDNRRELSKVRRELREAQRKNVQALFSLAAMNRAHRQHIGQPSA
jgi:homoserine dehydrogenase